MSLFKTVTELRVPVTWDTAFLKRTATTYGFGTGHTSHDFWERITYSGRYVLLKEGKTYECNVPSGGTDDQTQWINESKLQFPQETI